MGVLDTMATATATKGEVEIILDAELAAKWDGLSAQLQETAESDVDAGSLGLPKFKQVVDEMEAIRDQVAASKVRFIFEQMDWTDRLELQASHPPRDGNVADRMRGFNIATYVPALIKGSCVKVVDANGDEATEIPDETWDRLLGNPEAKPPIRPVLAHGKVTELFVKAQEVNQGETRVPPSARFLLGSLDSGASLAQPSPGTSPRSGSTGGSRRTSRKSSTAKKAAPKKAASSGT
jgi:hypothetical protein